ncbi:hypothetical protein [Ferdinandcohnia sp. Marseille-Q9671]
MQNVDDKNETARIFTLDNPQQNKMLLYQV